MALTDNLIHYYKFDESSGSASPTVGSLTLTNSSASYTTGKINNGAELGTSGSNSATLYNTSPGAGWFNLGGGSAKSISWWFKVNATPPTATNRFFDWRRSSATSGEMSGHYEPNGGTPRFYFYLNGTFFLHSVTLTTGQWYHLVITADASNAVKFYIDGTQVTTTTWGTAGSGNNFFQIGNANGSTSGNFGGPFSVDELGMWHRELTSTEVGELYNSGTGLSHPFSGGGGPTPASLLMMMGVG